MMIDPAFFDIFGVLAFIYIVIFATRGLRGRTYPTWSVVLLIIIGLAGLLVDSVVVYARYLQ
jgi:hypothetical protein